MSSSVSIAIIILSNVIDSLAIIIISNVIDSLSSGINFDYLAISTFIDVVLFLSFNTSYLYLFIFYYGIIYSVNIHFVDKVFN